MICFLTSRTDTPTGELDPANHFVEEMRRCFPNPCRALDICSNPDGWASMDYYSGLIRTSFEDAGFQFESFRTLDSRNEEQAAELVRDSNFIVLSGGHVPTQNAFFRKIGLRELMKDYDGIVVGISAGSMNSADVVYSHPEEEGEAVDPDYRRFLLLPHYQDEKDVVLDGLRVYEDIAFPDSMGRTFYAIPDGSYLFIDSGREELRGEAYMIRDGVLSRIAPEGGITRLD